MPPTSLTLTPPADWMDRAICHDQWATTDAETEQDERDARALCRACPAMEDCARWTLSLPPRQDVYGVAGGMTVKERELVRRRVRRRLPTGPEQPRACTRCEVVQPAGEFYLRPRYPGGRETQCRTCCQEKNRARKAAKKAALAAAVQTVDLEGIAS